MLEAEIHCIRQTLDEQQGHLRALQSVVTTCHEEIGALRDCLTSTGALDEDSFLVQLHRRHFATARRRCHLDLDSRWNTVAEIPAIALTVGQCTGHTAMRRLREASRATYVTVGDILGSLCPGHIYVCGGREGVTELSSAERFNPASQGWEGVPPLMKAREWTCSAVVTGRIYVCGGWGRLPLRSVERLDPGCGTWESMPPMLGARWGAAAAVVSGKLHVCGGLGETCEPLSTVERLELDGVGSSESPVWCQIQAMSERRGWPVAGALAGRLYVCGGRDEHRDPLKSVECLCTDGTAWEGVAHMAERRCGAAAAVVAGRLYVCGGALGAQLLSSTERFDPSAQSLSWESLPSMTSRRAYIVAAAVAGRLYVFGGYDGVERLNSAEQFDPATGDWSPLPSMSERRSGASATVLRV
eukprot:TRINITY_DN51084_c0_g1_i1.p1 TRINITY_DN51084_c0_g1~~TRINITY_DN51084_c0_g1_i1.p1  ORF type:complete len:414 (-),score=66.38 TRINITY_DN51084_c0_g1_i1:248-1489(-)